MSQPPASSLRQIAGPIHNVRCPNCGHAQDLRTIRDQGGMVEKGALISCDKCDMCSVVLEVVQVTHVRLIQDPKRRKGSEAKWEEFQVRKRPGQPAAAAPAAARPALPPHLARALQVRRGR